MQRPLFGRELYSRPHGCTFPFLETLGRVTTPPFDEVVHVLAYPCCHATQALPQRSCDHGLLCCGSQDDGRPNRLVANGAHKFVLLRNRSSSRGAEPGWSDVGDPESFRPVISNHVKRLGVAVARSFAHYLFTRTHLPCVMKRSMVRVVKKVGSPTSESGHENQARCRKWQPVRTQFRTLWKKDRRIPRRASPFVHSTHVPGRGRARTLPDNEHARLPFSEAA